MTVFGVIWMLLCFTSLFYNYKYTFSLLLLACVFQAAAVVNFSGKGVSPLLFTEVIFILRCVFIHKNVRFTYNNVVVWGALFVVISMISGIIFPLIYKGMFIYPPSSGVDRSFFSGGERLKLGASNLFQIVLLLINFLSLYFVYVNRPKISNDYLWKIIFNITVFIVFVGFWEYAGKAISLIPYPFEFFNSNEGYSQLHYQVSGGRFRLSGTFIEPSFMGAFLAASFWGMYAVNEKKTRVLSYIILCALALNLSGTGLVAMVIGALIYVILKGGRSIWQIAILATFILALLTSFGFLTLFNDMVSAKFDAKSSGVIRLGADLFTLNLIANTYGLGVGIGSHRSSSFLINLVASVGFIGSFIYFTFIKKLLYSAFITMKENKISNYLISFSLVLFSAQFIGIPDFSFPIMWFWMFAMASLDYNKLSK